MSKRGEKTQSDVLAVLRRRGGPLSAYDVLGELRESHPRIAPPTIYRALAALTERGRVHRLESMNAFIACQCDRHASVAGKSGFQPARHVIEIHGLCASCGAGQAPA